MVAQQLSMESIASSPTLKPQGLIGQVISRFKTLLTNVIG
jgi:hypothetical protein